MIINLANQITLTRIFFVVPVIVLLHFPNQFTCWIAAILFAVASVTDFLDGHIARRDNLVSSLGKFLDPLADKLLICSTLIMFTGLGWVPAWVTLVIVVREIAVTGLRAMAVDEGIVLAADKYGKLKTTIQSLAIVPLTVHYPFWGLDPQPVGKFLLYIALILTVFSGVNYFYAFYKQWGAKQV
jgi:CDP-diacylglycerol--glycerol-3-phosphate 3-phosphatidyltransferase